MLVADKPSTHAFCPKVGTIKDRNGRDLVNVEEIKKRREEYTEELFKKDLNDPDNHDGVITHTIQTSWSVKLSGPSSSTTTNKASGGDGIPAKLFQILKDDAVKALHSICQQIWKTQ